MLARGAKQCRHIKTNGNQCRGVALRGQPLCYFHDRLQSRERRLQAQPALTLANASQPASLALNIPTLEDADSIQVALSLIASALASNQLDPRRAGPLLYALQIASRNLRSTQLTFHLEDAVTTVMQDEDGVDLIAE
jgi:hypothetical protein